MEKYTFTVERTVQQWLDVDVEGETIDEALENAVELSKTASDFEWETIDGTGDDHQVVDRP